MRPSSLFAPREQMDERYLDSPYYRAPPSPLLESLPEAFARLVSYRPLFSDFLDSIVWLLSIVTPSSSSFSMSKY
jgi:hypothetical protein